MGSVELSNKTLKEIADFMYELKDEITELGTKNGTQSKQLQMYRDALDEIRAQRDMIFNSLCELRMAHPEIEEKKSPGSTWIGSRGGTSVQYHSKDGLESLPGGWVSSPETRAMLGEAEKLSKAAHYQQALIAIDTALKPPGITAEKLVNGKLLKSAIIRSTPVQVKKDSIEAALEYADAALNVAREFKFYHLRGKAQYFRALCFFELRRFQDASWALTFADGTPGYEDQVTVLKEFADTELEREAAEVEAAEAEATKADASSMAPAQQEHQASKKDGPKHDMALVVHAMATHLGNSAYHRWARENSMGEPAEPGDDEVEFGGFESPDESVVDDYFGLFDDDASITSAASLENDIEYGTDELYDDPLDVVESETDTELDPVEQFEEAIETADAEEIPYPHSGGHARAEGNSAENLPENNSSAVPRSESSVEQTAEVDANRKSPSDGSDTDPFYYDRVDYPDVD